MAHDLQEKIDALRQVGGDAALTELRKMRSLIDIAIAEIEIARGPGPRLSAADERFISAVRRASAAARASSPDLQSS